MQRNSEPKCRSFVVLAVNTNLSVHEFNKLLTNRETETYYQLIKAGKIGQNIPVPPYLRLVELFA